MKIYGYLAFLVSSFTLVSADPTLVSADPTSSSAAVATMTAKDPSVIAPVGVSSISASAIPVPVLDLSQEMQGNHELAQLAAAAAATAAASRGTELPPTPQQTTLVRRRRTVEEGNAEKIDGAHEKSRELQEQRNLRGEPVFGGKTGKFFDKTLEDYRNGHGDRRPLFRQFSMPLLGMGPFGLALGRPRGGRFRKQGGGHDNERRANEYYDDTEPQYE
jgi:hypothetical protein